MDVIRKHLSLKLAFSLLFGLLALAGVSYFAQQSIPETIVPYQTAIFLGIFFLIVIISSAVMIFNPLRTVFREMKGFLTAHPYKKIFTKRIDEVGVLAHFFNEVTRHIEKTRIAIAEGKRMSEELSVGSEIQQKILPKQMPQVPGLAIFGATRPASEVGGDSFDIIQTPTNTFVYVGDVTGHGLPAALIMVMVNTMIRTFSEIHGSGYDIVVNTNRVLKQRIEPRRFMTCVLLRWNSQEQRMYYTGAGHEHILIFRKQEGRCEVKQTGGIALGMVPDISKIIKEEGISLLQGDIVVLYSDGIIEAKNMEGEMFGLPRLQKTVEQYAATSAPEELFTHISKDFGIFVGEQVQEDDLTLIAVQRLS